MDGRMGDRATTVRRHAALDAYFPNGGAWQRCLVQLEKQGLILASELEFHQQISLLALDLEPGGLFPRHSFREQLPKPLGRRSPDFLRIFHSFTGPISFSVR